MIHISCNQTRKQSGNDKTRNDAYEVAAPRKHLLSFGPDVKIVAPEELRIEIQTNLEKAIQNYQS
ncbi:hypothetical protein [Listeria booriae]|uniref:WCX domain-containing protein n=1 Tax=Listeria booriae TaxID=1552123 RepID=A0A7X1DLC8_9LIST|nr:hypothetical protein [Listeria booriae]MBC2283642.1 hypothetical protein [Listeria booriae]MBC2293231.1 hypothetical protein [Listeria booriae]MBC2303568.1 hypothetical protein [Listeria booriae]MBC2312011.1 hypothetical protein [Listeria booriae]